MVKTKSAKKKEIKRHWHLVDAKGKILGRLATRIARLLIGKEKPCFTPHLDGGDYVVVVNASQIKVSGKKAEQKKYYRYSGYPGGLRQISFNQQMAKDPRKIIGHAVLGMLPKNKLQADRIRRLKIFKTEKHPYEEKFKTNKS